MRGERFAAPAITLLLVVSVVSGAFAPAGVAGPVGTVQAQSGDGTGSACGAADWFLTLATGTLLTTDCKTAGEVSEEWNETDANETKVQITSQAAQLTAGNDQFLTVASNYGKDSNTIAFSKGEAAAVESSEGGWNETAAQSAANDSIQAYYVTRQKNVVDRWNVVAETVATLGHRANTTDGVPDDPSGTSYVSGLAEPGADYPEGLVTGDTRNQTIELLDGSTTNITQIELVWAFNGERASVWLDITQDSYHMSVPGYSATVLGVFIEGYQERPHQRILISDFSSVYDSIEERNSRTQREVAAYITESFGPAVQNGELDAENYVSSATLAQEYAQEYGNGTSYIRATAIAASSGMDTPDLNQTGSMTITHDNESYEGLLLSQEAPSNGWVAGESYDPALLSGLQMFAVAGENSTVIELDGPFTVDQVTNTEGDPIDRATTFNVTYETSNASANYTALQEQIRDLNAQIEEREAQATSGGGGGDGGGSNPLEALASLLGVSAGAAMVVVAGAGLLAVRIYSP